MDSGSNTKTAPDALSSTSTSTSTSNKANAVTAQYNADARLMAEFEEADAYGKPFDYSKSLSHDPQNLSTEDQIVAYLSRIQRGGLVQPFGCMLAVQEPTFQILAHSENSSVMLGFKNNDGNGLVNLVGIDATTLFTPSSSSSLAKAAEYREISFFNPIWVHSRANNRVFYAILHRIDVGIVIDLEPAQSSDPAMMHAAAVQSQKLAVRAMSKLQSLPRGDLGVLFDTIVDDVQKLTGYDRVMLYKFHEDSHGEVLSEIRRSDLEPYLGFHYPATDIPQAARFLFKQNRVRMICDCKAEAVKVIQSGSLKQPLCLVNSTLRAPHGCHIQYMDNMGTIASLVLAVVINNGESTKLWGLVVCHHGSPRYLPYPLRYACEFLMQAFNLKLSMELQLASQVVEKKILHMQTVLCDMLLRDVPLGIVTQSPSIMDLVKCDGAALYYGGKCWFLGVTPTEAQLKDIVQWMLSVHGDSTGLSTECLADAGYPGAIILGDAVCGMVTARITSTDFLFWFRSHTAKEIKWGGAMHHPEDTDDGRKMHPRTSFNAFLEVVKRRSLPWETAEINAIHSLQLIMRNSLQGSEESGCQTEVCARKDGPCGEPQPDELTSVAVEMVRLIETATAPIFAVDSSGLINGWNAKMCELTGLEASDAIGKSLVNDVLHRDSREVVESLLARALQGTEDKNVVLKLLKMGTEEPNSVVYLVVNTCISRNFRNDFVGVCFVGQDITAEKTVMDKFVRVFGDYKTVVQSLNPLIPPIFASDENACCSEWNAVMEQLTGWKKHEIIGKLLPGEIFGSLCQLKGQDVLTKFMILLYRAISGHDTENLPFGFFNRRGEFVEVHLAASKRVDQTGNVIGCLCVLQTVVIDQKDGKQEENEKLSKELAYLKQEMKNPLNGIRFAHQLLERSAISDDQKQFLETSDACERQILSIIDDLHFGLSQEGKIELKVEEFVLGSVVNAILSQAMNLLREKNLRLVHDIPEEIKTLSVYGDQIKLQLALSDFLISILDHSPSSSDGWVEIKVSSEPKLIQDGNEFVHLQFRMAHPGPGLPSSLIEDMFDTKNSPTSQGGIALNLSQKLISMMNGSVRYVRDQNRCCFVVDIELCSCKSRSSMKPKELIQLLS